MFTQIQDKNLGMEYFIVNPFQFVFLAGHKDPLTSSLVKGGHMQVVNNWSANFKLEHTRLIISCGCIPIVFHDTGCVWKDLWPFEAAPARRRTSSLDLVHEKHCLSLTFGNSWKPWLRIHFHLVNVNIEVQTTHLFIRQDGRFQLDNFSTLLFVPGLCALWV